MKIQVGTTDHLSPEVQAMLMAMYSRSYAPIESRIPSSEESVEAHKEKLGKYYRDWGHKSVGQLGNTSVWIEGVSQLAAKAIENTKLFNGQESSTRYIDFSTQPFMHTSDQQIEWTNRFRLFYIKAQPQLVNLLKEKFPLSSQDPSDSETAYNNTIKARAFDILRGVLPAGATTNVVFSGTFDTLNDHFGAMLHHPLKECREIAKNVLTDFNAKYPFAAIPLEKLEKTFEYLNSDHFYEEPYVPMVDNRYLDLLVRPIYTTTHYRNKFEKVPTLVSMTNTSTFYSTLDFGSFRDLHRHRNGYLNMPCLTTEYGFRNYYLENLPINLRKELVELLAEFENYLDSSQEHAFDKQYMIPMGYQVPFSYTADLNQVMYILELRSSKTVHQTLREEIKFWHSQFMKAFPNVQVHVTPDDDNFTLKRGLQTFTGDFK